MPIDWTYAWIPLVFIGSMITILWVVHQVITKKKARKKDNVIIGIVLVVVIIVLTNTVFYISFGT